MKNIFVTLHFDRYNLIQAHLRCVQRAYRYMNGNFTYCLVDDGANHDRTMSQILSFTGREFPIHYFATNRRSPGENIYMSEAEIDNFIWSYQFLPDHENLIKADVEILFRPETMSDVFAYCATKENGGMHVHTANMHSYANPMLEPLKQDPNNYDKVYELIYSDPDIKWADESGNPIPAEVPGCFAYSKYASLPPTSNPRGSQYSSGLAFFGLRRELFAKTPGFKHGHVGYGTFDHEFVAGVRQSGITIDILETKHFNIQMPHAGSHMCGYTFPPDRPVTNPTYKFIEADVKPCPIPS